VRLDVDLGSDVSLGSPYGADQILSPDGTRLVYVSQDRLFTRRLDQPDASELAGTQGADAPFFSPDGQWVAFFAQGKLKKISVEGGAPIALCSTANARGGSWGEDGTIMFASDSRAALSKISSAGGRPEPLTTLDDHAGEVTQRWPQVLPGAKAVLFTSSTHGYNYDDASIIVYSMASGQRKTVQLGGSYARYLPNGHIVYIHEGTLFAVPFDLQKLEVRGTPTPVLSQVGYSAAYGSAQFDFSQNGTLIYRGGGGERGLLTVQWLDATGKTQPLLAKADTYQRPTLSPDGTKVAIVTTDIWVYEWQRDTMTRLTFGPVGSNSPTWSPDGRYIMFRGQGGMFWTRSDGSGKPQFLTQSKNAQFPSSFTADGKRLAFSELNPETQFDLWTVALKNDSAGLRALEPEPFLQTPFDERHPSFSPDGRWMAYDSNESGILQVYVRAFPDKGGKWQISNSGGVYPEWSRNGHELFFRTEDSQIMVASYTVKGDSFVADKPRVWSEMKIANVGLLANYDVAPDGKRIVALMPARTREDQKAQTHVIFIENFFDEVRRRTATQAK
jgi:Tol biopolymer transport system component